MFKEKVEPEKTIITTQKKRILALAGSNGCTITDSLQIFMVGTALFDDIVAKEFSDEETAKRYALLEYANRRMEKENKLMQVFHFPTKFGLNDIWIPGNLSEDREAYLKKYGESQEKNSQDKSIEAND